jgi:hypothetical protein
MFEEHPNCQKPNDKNIKIWRFIDFSKFISMLLNNSIYFSGIKHFGDPFEDKFSLFSLKKKKSE